ncbi:unnamed protein product [Effrenium voratum]|uniref:Uncharacterized protein n=1 Tax=Effrenium voratum TaxID=2562239 RepID=A0AA36IU44_9DINO|nr:unnamed protein product [Effrenium voratum]CAJ1422199.1 unnamed protein product [Effrenium voratum]
MVMILRPRRPRMVVADGHVSMDPPEDMHFTAAKLCLEGEKPWQGLAHLAFAFGIVILQLTVAWCLFSTMGNTYGACATANDCGRAMWCTVTQHPRSSSGGMCLGCGFRDGYKKDLAAQFCHVNGTALSSAVAADLQLAVEAPDSLDTPQPIYMTLTTADVDALCSDCISPRGFMPRLAKMNIKGIGVREGVMYALVAAASALCIMEESLALFKTLLYLHRVQLPDGMRLGLWGHKRRALLLLQTARVFTLASVLMCVPLFILFDSADGVSILLNTVACLFILELDNLAFAYGVRELQRTEILEPFTCSLADATNVERAKELVALASLLGISLVGLGHDMESTYLVLPWALVIIACTIGEALLTCCKGRKGVDGGGRGVFSLFSTWLFILVRLALMFVLTLAYPIMFSGGTWWIPY